MTTPAPAPDARIVLFDGVCNLCDAVVQTILDHDPAGRFQFASLQSETAAALLRARGAPPVADPPESLILIEGATVYTRSTAALRIARGMSGLYPILFYAFILVPRFLRDPIYAYVARNRYRWFGKNASCRVPTPELRARFLDAGAASRGLTG